MVKSMTLIFALIIVTILVTIVTIRLMRAKTFTQSAVGHIVNPEHTFELEMLTEIAELQQRANLNHLLRKCTVSILRISRTLDAICQASWKLL
jgi:hypothetical protein